MSAISICVVIDYLELIGAWNVTVCAVPTKIKKTSQKECYVLSRCVCACKRPYFHLKTQTAGSEAGEKALSLAVPVYLQILPTARTIDIIKESNWMCTGHCRSYTCRVHTQLVVT